MNDNWLGLNLKYELSRGRGRLDPNEVLNDINKMCREISLAVQSQGGRANTVTPLAPATPLVVRTAEDYPVLLSDLLEADSVILYNILKWLSRAGIKKAREVCKQFSQIIDCIAVREKTLLQGCFFVRMLQIDRVPYICDKEREMLPELGKDDIKQLDSLEKVGLIANHARLNAQTRLVRKNLKLGLVIYNNGSIQELHRLIAQKDTCLCNIEGISFDAVTSNNIDQVHGLLNTIFESQELFPYFKKLSFGHICGDVDICLNIPGFSGLEILDFNGVIQHDLTLGYFPTLKRIAVRPSLHGLNENAKKALYVAVGSSFQFRDLSRIDLDTSEKDKWMFSAFVNCPENEPKFGIIEKIVIHAFQSDVSLRCQIASEIIAFIHSHQELFVNLKRLELALVMSDLTLPKFRDGIDIVQWRPHPLDERGISPVHITAEGGLAYRF